MSQKIPEKDIEIGVGNSYPIIFYLTNKRTKLPIDIAGWTFVLTVTSIPSPPDDTTKVFDVAGAIVDAAGGAVGFTPTTGDTATEGSHFHDSQYTDDSGNVRTWVRGKFNIVQGRTQ